MRALLFFSVFFLTSFSTAIANDTAAFECLNCHVEAVSEGQIIVNYDLKMLADQKRKNRYSGTLELRFFDHDGKPVLVKDVSLQSEMVGMGHGAGKEPTASAVKSDNDGASNTWVSSDIFFTMKGVWRITVRFKGPGKDDQARIIAWVKK